jgi:hypothetical protein
MEHKRMKLSQKIVGWQMEGTGGRLTHALKEWELASNAEAS